jgi:outer membrane protein assembly factor BamB
VAAGACVLALMAAASPAAARTTAAATTAWPQFAGNAAHTADEAAERSVTIQNVNQLTVAWTQTLPQAVDFAQSEPAVSGGTAYVVASDNVYAFNATTGAQLWETTMPEILLGTPAVQGGLVLVSYNTGTRDHPKGWVAALNAATGAITWSKEVGDGLQPASLSGGNSITTTTDRAYVSLVTGEIVALSLSTGHRVWESPMLPGAGSPGSLCTPSVPSVSGDFVLAGVGGFTVDAISTATGAVAWSQTLGSGSCSESASSWVPSISGGTVYVGWMDGVAALTLSSGSVLWDNEDIQPSAIFPLSVTADDVIASVSLTAAPSEDRLVAYSLSTGALVWQSTTSLTELFGNTFGDLTWAMSSSSTSIQAAAFDAATGQLEYTSAALSDNVQTFAPVVDAGHVYLDTGSALMCLALPS